MIHNRFPNRNPAKNADDFLAVTEHIELKIQMEYMELKFSSIVSHPT